MSLKNALLLSLCLTVIPVLALAQSGCGGCPMAAQKACAATTDSSKKDGPVYAKLPGYDKKVWIGEDYYFTYKWAKRPQIGTIILKVQVFTKGGKQTKELAVTGEYGMPSMRGAHDSGVQAFKTNQKRDYLMPVSLVMRGEWEVKLVFADKDGKPLYHGMFTFKV
jgi:hypothetical protein